ncbi:hypothetical protein E2C01_054237 [Portunus trituberculatus]|uniref:Uncharacterized protein n=1 Tax=Portunus trituberculatus TaxID=210409 RepID=A0A5B7GRG6_PORTR|nr:hypothetical protein [Portunus trituberculatus]
MHPTPSPSPTHTIHPFPLPYPCSPTHAPSPTHASHPAPSPTHASHLLHLPYPQPTSFPSTHFSIHFQSFQPFPIPPIPLTITSRPLHSLPPASSSRNSCLPRPGGETEPGGRPRVDTQHRNGT